MTEENPIRVQLDHRKDGRISVTLKLVAWDMNQIRAFGAQLLRGPVARQVGEKLFHALQGDAESETSSDV